MKNLLLPVLISFLLPNVFFAQNIFNHLELNVGYGVQHQDRRFFDSHFGDGVIAHEKSFYDHQFDININATLVNKSIYSISAGVGYSQFETKFSRPFDAYYFGDYSEVLHYVGNYKLHNLSLLNTYKIVLNADKKNVLSLIFPLRGDFTFNKHMIVNHRNESFSKNVFEFNKLELYMGLNARLNRCTFSLLYRVFNYQKIDPVLINGLLFHEPEPAFLDKKYEVINFYKLMANVGYIF